MPSMQRVKTERHLSKHMEAIKQRKDKSKQKTFAYPKPKFDPNSLSKPKFLLRRQTLHEKLIVLGKSRSERRFRQRSDGRSLLNDEDVAQPSSKLGK